MPDIRNWLDIDTQWLNEALQAGGVSAQVRNFTTKPVGTGQIGDCVRFSLTYDDADADAPKTLVGKFPAEGEESRATGISLGNYYREVKFYQTLRDKARIATPNCYFTDIDERTQDFVLIMDDAAPAEQGDQLTGVSMDQAMTVVREAAKMHAAFWNDDTLEDFAWVNGTPKADNPVQPDIVQGLWAGFKQRYGDRVSPAAHQIGDALCNNLEAYDTLRAGPRTLIHTDFRPDNMLFATAKGGAPLLVVDWQSFAYGPPASDIGYFTAGAIDAKTRRERESELFAAYFDELNRQGAGPYNQDDFKRHYVSGAYQHFLTAFFAAMLVTQTDRGDDMFFKMLNGAVDLIRDNRAENWFD